MSRIAFASITFWTLLSLDVFGTVGGILGLFDISFGIADYVVSAATIPLSLVVAVGLLARREWARNLGILYVGIFLLDCLRIVLVDSGFSLESVAIFSFVLLLGAGVLWVLDADRLRDSFDPPISPNAIFRANLARPATKLGLLLLGTSLAGSIWGGLVLVLWAALFFTWRKYRVKRAV